MGGGALSYYQRKREEEYMEKGCAALFGCVLKMVVAALVCQYLGVPHNIAVAIVILA